MLLAGASLVAVSIGCRQEPPDLPEIFTTRAAGTTFLERGQLPEAEQEFRKLIQLAPDDPLGYANLGLTFLRAGRYSHAEEQLRRAERLDPGSAEVGLIVARLYSLTGRWAEARATLEKLRRDNPRDAMVLYALSELEARDSSGRPASDAYELRLREVLEVTPANLAVRLRLTDVLVRRGEADSAIRHLEEVRRLRPEPPREAIPRLSESIALLRAGRVEEARRPFDRFLHLMELSQAYQAALVDIKWLEGPIVGRPVLTFKPQSLIQMYGATSERTADRMRFSDVTLDAGFAESRPSPDASAAPPPDARTALVVSDFDGDGADELFVTTWSGEQRTFVTSLYAIRAGQVMDVSQQWGLAHAGGAVDAAVGDFDNDGWLDLFVIGVDGDVRLLKNTGERRFADVTARSGLAGNSGASKALFIDLDHDGDLDLLLIGGAVNRVYRNNADGTFAEIAAAAGLAAGRAMDADFADLDGDGRTDVVMATERGPVLYRNTGMRRFADVTSASGLGAPAASGGAAGAGQVAVSDYDNDGMLDVALTVLDTGVPALWRNAGDGTFRRDSRSDGVFRPVRSLADVAMRFVDVDNDGWLDLLVVGAPRDGSGAGRGAFLFHNDGNGRYEDRSRVLPPALQSGRAIAPCDIDGDGDLDLLIGDARGVRVLRNEDGNASLSVQVALVGLRTGSGRNNTFGIGSKLELRAGEIFQTRVATGPVTHFGLGPHLKADVLRVEWPNGVPQTIYFPGTDEDVLELEQLKGSCAFAYTWDGERFRFVTDVMWRSALGMPLGLMGSTSAFAPAGASQEYLRIPGDALRPRNGRYAMQLTEELWETAYLDEVKLLAVDHPDSVEVFIDERFVPPGPVELRLFEVVRPRAPLSATDSRGNDILPALRASDDVYVSNLTPTQYQGVVEPHDLVLELDRAAGDSGTFLFLRGWIYPTDASINVALSQHSGLKVTSPSLEVRNARGQWQTAVADIGFPSGKDKTIVVDLAGRFPTTDRRVRIRTNMQVYWDQAFVAKNESPSLVRVTTLTPVSADLRFRGFSRMYRKGGRYGPFWFAYDDVVQESPWRPIHGTFTRFGDVLPLLGDPDDMYVVMGPGDETTVEFDATSERALPAGWKRDFLLYTDGWIKDSDLNTAFGTTVEPLPFHGMKSYPYAPGDAYPAGAAHQQYLREYHTRVVSRSGSQR
jgi:Flp pilus assembly protein TadD